MRKIVSCGFAAVLAAAPAAPVVGQEPSPEHVRRLIEQALGPAQPADQQQAPATTAERAPVSDLSVDEAVARAFERNLDLEVQRLNPRLADYQIVGILASYRPTLTSAFQTQASTSLPTSQLQGGGSRISTDNMQWNSGLQQGVPWGGGNLMLNWNNTRQETSDTTALRNPSYTSNFFASYTQPLFRNFRTDAVRTSLLTARITQEIEDISLRATITNTEASVRNAYWDLVFAVQNVEAAQRSLELATKLVQDNRARVEIGTMAPIDVVQAQAEEATRRQAVVQAEATLRTSELALKRLLVSGTDDPLWTATINPTDRPSPVAEPIDLEAAVRFALQNRTDMATARKNLEQNDINIRNLRNLTMPGLDLVANYQLQGRGGIETQRQGFGGPVINVIPGGYFDALRNITNFDAPTWTVRLNFSYPIGTSAADASLARARIQAQQTQAQIKQAELQIATDVANAALNVRNTLEAVQAATAARELSERRLEAAQSKFDVGMATNFEVVQAQRDLADARTSELREQLNYRKALVDFQRSQLTGSARSVTSIR